MIPTSTHTLLSLGLVITVVMLVIGLTPERHIRSLRLRGSAGATWLWESPDAWEAQKALWAATILGGPAVRALLTWSDPAKMLVDVALQSAAIFLIAGVIGVGMCSRQIRYHSARLVNQRANVGDV